MKTCAKCAASKPRDAFGRDSSRLDGLQSWCRDCRNAAARRYRSEHPEKAREARERYLRRHPGADKEAVRRYQAIHPRRGQGPERQESLRQWRQANRDAVFAHYGRACVCCGSTEVLTIDHINGDGKEHRAQLGIRTGSSMMLWLVRNGFPDGFQTLCRRCNTSKGRSERCRLNHGQAEDAAA